MFACTYLVEELIDKTKHAIVPMLLAAACCYVYSCSLTLMNAQPSKSEDISFLMLYRQAGFSQLVCSDVNEKGFVFENKMKEEGKKLLN